MNKFITKFLVALSFFTVSVANAGLITTDLTEDNYINYKNLDWAWASPVNVQYVRDLRDSSILNQLYDPTIHTGWRYASLAELYILKTELTLSDFTKQDKDGNSFTVQAVEYWNSNYVRFNTEDFNNDWVNSAWTLNPGIEWNYETFYVRDAAQVPEPSSIMIFAIALIALSMRKRTAK